MSKTTLGHTPLNHPTPCFVGSCPQAPGEYVDENAAGPAARSATLRGPQKPVTNIPLRVSIEEDGGEVPYGLGFETSRIDNRLQVTVIHGI